MQSSSPNSEPSPSSDSAISSQKRKRRTLPKPVLEKRLPHLNQTASRWALLPLMLLVWLAPFLGGAVQPWAAATVFLLLALLFILYPISHACKKRFAVFLVGLVLLPLAAFLPVALTGLPGWRLDLAQHFSIPFPGTITPQPWLTLDAWLAWLGGVAWIYWLSGQGWTREIRKPLAELFAAGMILLTAIGLIGYHTHHPLPFWHAERLFGPFPNRNQTANLLSLSFIVVIALLHMAVLKKAKIAAVWVVGLFVLGYGLIVNFSKAGIVLPALGASIYWLVSILTSPSRTKTWIGVACVALAVALLLAFGGETLERFTPAAGPADSLTSDYRWHIFADTWQMIRQHPLFGVGLGNFAFVFPLFRNVANGTSGIIHPESDWLWLAAEVGWPGAAAILGAAAWLVYRAFCFSFRKPHPLRLAGAICGFLFLLHGFYDVSGHRFGTLFPACFLFALCWPGQATPFPISLWLSRGIALALTVVGLLFSLNTGSPSFSPGLAALATAQKNAEKSITLGHGREALETTNAALRWAPLDWELYYKRGTARILLRQDWAESLLDYRRANRLERFSPIAPENEGLAWLSYRPEIAALPWAVALERLPAEERDRKYARFLEIAGPYPRLHDQLEMLGGHTISQWLIQLNNVSDADFPAKLSLFLQKHPNPDRFPPENQRALLDLWAGRGKPQEMIAAVEKMPRLLPAGTIPYASAHARLGRYETACKLLFKYLPSPKLPGVSTPGSEAQLDQEFQSHSNLAAGLTLFKLQMEKNDLDAALLTLERLERLPDSPPYLFYFNARILARQHNWQNAWEALYNYQQKNHL